eukprot:CAMPEP_0201496232 /NCGR_PEP_ID=MMETSP0151_2-20130828/58627_1 /ASSEMBLY_ACC=CAM_ASM_000257 /TAXON_ID=200890 /ORGANISM="Paramoeba atlantica, Strain 621/1 / CCAP 1560/9" /LENGTH=197 /DNA_ID=CAMNT_0047885893 /DNA_START=90 /DNA_END=683 /DNA_ORIENTATION=-
MTLCYEILALPAMQKVCTHSAGLPNKETTLGTTKSSTKTPRQSPSKDTILNAPKKSINNTKVGNRNNKRNMEKGSEVRHGDIASQRSTARNVSEINIKSSRGKISEKYANSEFVAVREEGTERHLYLKTAYRVKIGSEYYTQRSGKLRLVKVVSIGWSRNKKEKLSSEASVEVSHNNVTFRTARGALYETDFFEEKS